MINKETIKKICDRLVKTYSPEKIYLFGSAAWGTPNKYSDLDILILVSDSDEKSYKRSIKGELALADIMISRDLLVYTKDEFDFLASDVTSLCYKIKEEGRVIYANA